MSLRFIYDPPPRIRLIRHQTINFFASEPRIHFTKIKRQNIVKVESETMPRERERERDRDRDRDRDRVKEREKDRERIKDKDWDREKSSYSESSFVEKKKVQRQKTSSALDKSFLGCYELLQSIKNKKKLKLLFSLQGPEPSLPQIEINLQNCSYKSIDEFFRDLLDFFDGAVESYITDDETQKSAQNFIKKIEQEQGNMINRKPIIPYSDLRNQFQKFTDVKVPLPKQSNVSSVSSSSSKNLTQLAQDLNKLDPKKKLRAEWLIRIQCPTLPYYSNGIDLLLLPDTVVDSLIELINSK